MFGLFSKESALNKAKKKALQKMGQSAERWGAMKKLADHGDEDCLYTLCKRFSFQSGKMVEDEEEKAWVVRTLIGKGDDALPALRRYMLTESAVAYPLRVLEEVTQKEETLAVFDELLAAEPAGYAKDTTKRIAYIDWISEYEEATGKEVAERVTPYLQDFDENTRFAAVEAISLKPDESAALPLVTALLNEEEESGRLKVRIAEVLAEADLSLCDRHKEVADLFDSVLPGFKLSKNRLKKTD